MTEDEIMALVGRLYVGNITKQNEIERLKTIIYEYEHTAKTPITEYDDDEPAARPA